MIHSGETIEIYSLRFWLLEFATKPGRVQYFRE
jgi:hypothetical protein